MPRQNEDSLSWTPAMDDALVDAFLHQNNIGNRVNSTFTAKAYKEIVEELKTKIGPQVDKNKVKNRWKTLKANFSKCFDLFKNGMSGFAWSPVTNMWSAEPEVWERLIEAHPHAAEWKSKAVPNYEKMAILYGKDRAIGETTETINEILSGNDGNDFTQEEFESLDTISGIDRLVSGNKVKINPVNGRNAGNVNGLDSPEYCSIDEEFKRKNKKARKSKNEAELIDLKEAFSFVAEALNN